jgi:Diadenosine tetraphosphate (Ap4A) hydrolase and other HIT family hydrolases
LPDQADCAFCRIAAGEEDAVWVVLEEAHAVAFLDHRPLFPGHCLVIPREHYETLADLPQELLEPFFSTVQLLSRAIPDAMKKPGSFVAMNNVVSQSVPHLHVHVVPRKPKDGLRGFFWPRQKYESDEQRDAARDAVRAALERLR